MDLYWSSIPDELWTNVIRQLYVRNCWIWTSGLYRLQSQGPQTTCITLKDFLVCIFFFKVLVWPQITISMLLYIPYTFYHKHKWTILNKCTIWCRQPFRKQSFQLTLPGRALNHKKLNYKVGNSVFPKKLCFS